MKKILILSLFILASIIKARATDYYTAAPNATLTSRPGSSENWTRDPSGLGTAVRFTPSPRDNFFVKGNAILTIEDYDIPLVINNLTFTINEGIPTLNCNLPFRINGNLSGTFRREGSGIITFTGTNVQLSFTEEPGSFSSTTYLFTPSNPAGSQITLLENCTTYGRVEISSGANLILNNKRLTTGSLACVTTSSANNYGKITGGSGSSIRIQSSQENEGSQIMMDDLAYGSSNFLSSLSISNPRGQPSSFLKILNRLVVSDLSVGPRSSIDLGGDCRILGTYSCSGFGLTTTSDSPAIFGNNATIDFIDQTSTPIDARQPVPIEFEDAIRIRLLNFTGTQGNQYELISTRMRGNNNILIFDNRAPFIDRATIGFFPNKLILNVPLSIPLTQQEISFQPPGTKTYGEEDFDPLASSTAGLEITYTSDNEAVAKIESGKIRITGAGEATITASQAGNSAYEAAIPVSHPLTVLRKEISLTLNSSPAISKIYDKSAEAALQQDNFVLNGVLAEDDVTVTATAAYDNENAGLNKPVTAGAFELGGSNANSYQLVTTTAGTTGRILAKPLTVSLNLAPAITREYDGSTVARLTADNYTLTGLLSDDQVFVSGTAAYDNKNTAPAKQITVNDFILSGPQKDNYIVETPSAITYGSITRKTLTIKADNKEKLMGMENPALSVSYRGFVNTENNTVLTAQPEISTTATISSPIGTYPITASGAAAVNYDISYEDGILSVNPSGPTDIRLTAVPLYENQPAGTLAGTLSSISDDPNATFTYSLENTNAYADNTLFSISGNRIICNSLLDYEQKPVYTVLVRSTTQHGVSLDQVFNINLTDINEAPTMNIIRDQVICYTAEQQTIALSDISAGPETNQTPILIVTNDNGNLLENVIADKTSDTEGTLRYTVRPGASGVATLTILLRDNGGTENEGTDTFSQSFTITVNARPEITISSDSRMAISKGEAVTLNASVSGSPAGISYSWSDGAGIISGGNTSALTVRPAATTTYTLTALNASGCSEQKSITVSVRDDLAALHAKNIITPNGDGKNDTWIIDNIDMYPNNEVNVYDRAGRMIFRERGYKNTWQGTLNGSALAEGTYYYIVDFDGRGEILKGYITIVRD